MELVGLDRDGTINVDDNYLLGISDNWRSQVELLPGVVEGIRLLNTLSGLEVFIISNQAGVALKGPKYDLLDEKRMHEVNDYIIGLLDEKGAKIRGCFLCPFIDLKYVEKSRQRGREVHEDYVFDNHPDLKPNIGMLRKAAECLGLTLEECSVDFIGDRSSDVQMGLNANGRGILVPSVKTIELGDVAKVEALRKSYPDRIYIASDFLDAARYIERLGVNRT
jgi:HAD superfamily hydrolase (TIGR01662 family)